MLLRTMEISQGTAQKLVPQEESDSRDTATEINPEINRGTNTVHIPTKQG